MIDEIHSLERELTSKLNIIKAFVSDNKLKFPDDVDQDGILSMCTLMDDALNDVREGIEEEKELRKRIIEVQEIFLSYKTRINKLQYRKTRLNIAAVISLAFTCYIVLVTGKPKETIDYLFVGIFVFLLYVVVDLFRLSKKVKQDEVENQKNIIECQEIEKKLLERTNKLHNSLVELSASTNDMISCLGIDGVNHD